MNVTHNEVDHRFELVMDGGRAFLTYERRDDRLILIHTEVPPQFEGRGCGGLLVRAAAGYARQEGLRVAPLCRFASAYLARHPELADTVAPSADTIDTTIE
jgi:predicted GNAT family acetyltransferase